MKTFQDLPVGVQIRLSIQSDEVTAQYVSVGGRIEGIVGAYRHCGSLWSVHTAVVSVRGYGPLLYHCVLEILSEVEADAWLCSSRGGTHPEAIPVWEFFFTHGKSLGVEARPVPDHLRSRRRDYYTDPQYDILNCSYRKLARNCLAELRELGKLVEEYKPE